MKEKVTRPDKFVPGVTEVEILQRFEGDDIERLMHLGSGDDRKPIREIIHVDERTKTTIFKLVGDPIYTGFVTNTVLEEEGLVELDYTLHWTPRDPASEPTGGPDFSEILKAAVLRAKQMAEARARTSSG